MITKENLDQICALAEDIKKFVDDSDTFYFLHSLYLGETLGLNAVVIPADEGYKIYKL